MTGLDRLAQAVAAMTPAPWRYAQLLDGIEARALLDANGYHFGQCDDLENGAGIAMLRNCAEELMAVARAAQNLKDNPLSSTHTDFDCMDNTLIALNAKLETLR